MSASVIEAQKEVLFGAPQDTYKVSTQSNKIHNDREAFIAKVRSALTKIPRRAVVEDVVLTPPPAEEPAEPTDASLSIIAIAELGTTTPISSEVIEVATSSLTTMPQSTP